MINLTLAPIPKWTQIIKAIMNQPLSLDKLAGQWKEKNEKGYWLSRSTWSIYLIVNFRLITSKKTKINLWLPDYFCNEALAAIRSLDVNLSFYPVLSNGRPDLADCNKMLSDGLPDVILYVNYFGESLFSKGLSDLAKKNKAWLIEDSAHCLKPASGIGNHGDFVIYSPHKFLSIPDGALLVIRNTGPNKITNEFLENSDFDSHYYSVINNGTPSKIISFKWLFKRLIQKIGLQLFHNLQVFNSDADISSIKQLPHPKMSKVAQSFLSNAPNLELEAVHRKEIQMAWCKILDNDISLKGLKINQSKITYTPYLAKIRTSGRASSEDIFNFFQNLKLPISTWPDLSPEVLQDSVRHKIAINLRLSCIFFPVHSSINLQKLRSKIRRV